MVKKRFEKQHLKNISLIFLIISALIGVASRTFADTDLWGHLRFGLDMIQVGKIIHEDHYSYLSQGQTWINHELLSEISFAAVWLAGNVTGLILLKTAVVILSLGTAFVFLIYRQVTLITAGILVFLTWFGIQPAMGTIRPHMFTVLFSALLLMVLVLAERSNLKWLWGLPPIFLLWVNFHGGFLAGLGFLSVWVITKLLISPEEWHQFLPPVLLCFVVIFINPYGVDLITFLLRTATVRRPEIVEWQPIRLFTNLGIIYVILLLVGLFGYRFSRKDKPLPLIIVFIVAAILPLTAVRHLPLFSLAVLILAGEHIADSRNRIQSNSTTLNRGASVLITLSILLGAIFLYWSYRNTRQIWLENKTIPVIPSESVALLTDSEISGNLAVEFDWGEYVIWHLGPEVQVSVDGRRETVYSEEIYQTNLAFLHGETGWSDLLDNYDTQAALVVRNGVAYDRLLTKPGWELIYEDQISSLFGKEDWNQFEELRNHAAEFDSPPSKAVFP